MSAQGANTWCVICLALAGRWETCSAAEPVPELKLFSVPSIVLRTNVPASTVMPATNELASTLDFSLTSKTETPVELSMQRYEAMNGTSLMKVPEFQSEPGGAYGFVKSKMLDPITTLDVVQFKKVQFTGGLVGALKNRNPFYLLNPLVFAIDW